MNFPFNAFHELSLDSTLMISLVIGLGFGAMLEKGGFGSSKVLSGIFYGKDWRVLKVMFTAIVTAMLGLYAVQGMGWIAMDQIAFRPTYLGGQIVGGLLLGAGFVTAGYCPGTSMVGLVSGKLDALFTMLGILLGIGVFEEAYSAFAGVRDWGDMGVVSLSDWMGISNGYVVLLVTMMAIGAFSAVGYFERKSSGLALMAPRPQSAIGATLAGAFLVAAIQFVGPGDARAMGNDQLEAIAPVMQPAELAEMAIEGRTDFLVLDLRPENSLVELPSAWQVAPATLTNLRTRPDLPKDRRLILVDDGDLGHARKVAFSLREAGLDALVLQGGAMAWNLQILDQAAVSPVAQSYRMMMTGKSPILDGSAPLPRPKKNVAPPTRKKKKGGGCS